MNTATLDTVAFDNFETAGNDYLESVEGGGWVLGAAGAILGGLGGGLLAAGSGADATGVWGGAISGAVAGGLGGLAITTPISPV
ncbi:hypothetical protein ACVR0O_04700 [Streptococcus caviae]|uniref:hypothetical protein n=1 Tax=Streptococcus sp. 'caviae' TaxID=1915004 RepID=UPI00094B8FF0|nr:hypothetical protein [Streptococcus sp. 'caviae']OLN84105.1 hypothetical protein BMI76_02590 [Streptococcus sp. 'caviae']